MMDCLRVHELLDDWRDGALGSADAAAFDAHLVDCAECAAVVRELEGELDDALVVGPVLAATSGRPCSRVQTVLAGDPEATDADRARAADHVARCAGCAAVARVLAELPELLPTLAEADPGPGFTAEVLLATLPRPSLWSVFLTRMRDHVERWVRRPQFAQELSFALTVLLVLVTTLPGSPLRDAPRQALSVVRLAGIGPAPQDLAIPDDQGTVGGQLRQELRARGERLGAGFDRLGDHVLGAGRGLVEGDLEVVEENAWLIGCDLRRLWTGVREPAVDPDAVCG